MAFFSRFLEKQLGVKLNLHKRRSAPSGLTPTEERDLGFDNAPSGVSTEMAAGGPNLPALVGPTMGVLTTSPTYVSRAKCPRGYTFIATGGGRTLRSGPAGTCVLTKVARALGFVHRRGRGISSRDLRAALRVQRLVHRLAPKMGVRRHGGGHGAGCACKRCK
jgi:hypothetical protein